MTELLLPSSNLDAACFQSPRLEMLQSPSGSTHPPRILMLYGSLRERSYSKLLTLEAARLLETMGAEVKIYDPADRYSERKESAEALSLRVNQRAT